MNFFTATHIQTLEKNKVVTFFYGLILIPMDESAESLKDVLVKRLRKDQTYDAVKKNIVGFVSDSASVMVRFHNQILSTLLFNI